MRTTLNVDDSLLKTISKLTGKKNKTEIINSALSQYLGHIRRQNVMNAYGKLDIDLDVRAIRNSDLQRLDELST